MQGYTKLLAVRVTQKISHTLSLFQQKARLLWATFPLFWLRPACGLGEWPHSGLARIEILAFSLG